MDIKKIISIEFWLVPIFILLVAGQSILFTNNFQILLLTAVLGYFFIRERHEFDVEFIYVAIYWVMVNFISIKLINTDQPYSIVTVFSRLMYLLAIYFIIKLSGKSFFDVMNKHVFILTIISLPLYALQITNLHLILKLGALFRPFTIHYSAAEGHWYSYFFMFSTWHPTRNCGFMWEPGAFAGFLIFFMTYRFINNDFKIDKYIIVYFIALLTTISTAGYLALGFISIAYFIKHKRNYLLWFVLPLALFMVIRFYQKSDFMSGKIQTYLEFGTDKWGLRQEDGSYNVNRLGYAIIILDESRHWPFGHGIINHSSYKLKKYGRIIGPGAVASVLHQWGWVGIFVLVFCLFQFYHRRQNLIFSFLFTAALLIILFSNPWTFLLLIYSIIFYVFIFKKESTWKESDLANSVSDKPDKP